jgi:signal transduction histidine kinase/CheY-like chemotaxis protein
MTGKLPRPRRTDEPFPGRPRVLIVDDDRDLADTLAQILATGDLDVECVATGAEAAASAARHPPDVVLADVLLPDVSGIELLQRLRATSPDVDVVIVTGHASVRSAVDALNLGARRYVLKPCEPEELLSAVRDLLDRRQLQRRNRLYLHRLEVQNALSGALAAALSPEDVARATLDAVCGLGDVDTGTVLGLAEPGAGDDGPGPRLRPLASRGLDVAAAEALGRTEDVADLLSARMGAAPGMKVVPGGPGVRGPLALCRLRGREADLGVLIVATGRQFMMDEHHWELLMAIANWAGVGLERAVLYRRLQRAYDELKNAQRRMIQAEKLSAVGRLAAGLAHEVGTPLNVISGRAEYLLRDAEGNPRMEQGLRVIVQQIDRISRLIAQVLDFSREYGPVRDRIDLAAVVAAVQPLLAARLEKSAIDLELFLPPGLPRVVANFNQLEQVFINLLMNAIDAVVADDAHLRAKPRGRIAVIAEVQPRLRKVRVTIEDDGQGIREEHQDQVFDPFFSTKPVGAGTGLGLAVVYGIVTEHGGTIDIESTWGAGTRVRFTLPTEAV